MKVEITVVMVCYGKWEMDRTRTAPRTAGVMCRRSHISINGPEQTINPSVSGQAAANDRGTDVKKSEGGPGRGYYLNGKFYSYTDDEKSEQ